MGAVLLVCRLVVRDLRRRPAEAALFLLAITAATATLALGLAAGQMTDILYDKTRAATAGPDVVVVTANSTAQTRADLARVADGPHVTGHSGPYTVFDTTLRAHGHTLKTVVEARGVNRPRIEHPQVTSGSWLRPGGAVLERGFADVLGIHVGERVSVHGHSYPVVGLAVTAGDIVFPWQGLLANGGGGPEEHQRGLVWLTPTDARAAADGQSAIGYVMNLRLDDPERAVGYGDYYRGVDDAPVLANFQNWHFIRFQDSVLVRDTMPALVIGSWLLAAAAVVGLAGLVTGRAAQQTRRVGVLKAVGATPGLVAVVLLIEHLLLAALAAALGLLIGTLVAPVLADPSAGLLGGTIPPSPDAITGVIVLAVVVPLFAVFGPTVRAATTSTVRALADTPREAQGRAPLTALSAHLPTSLLLGVRLITRRPRRAVLVAVSTATVSVMVSAMVVLEHQTVRRYDFGSTTLNNVHDAQTTQVMFGICVTLGLLAAVNTMVLTWSVGLDARHPLAIARTLGATPGQITAGLCVAQVLPALPGVVVGSPIGLLLYLVFSPPSTTMPSTGSLLTALLAILLGTAAFAAVPAWLHTRRPATDVLSAETA